MLEKLNEVTKYIEEHITETICHDKLAKIACCSLHQFGRMFSYITGISLSEYIRRRKMSVAALDLQDSESKVSEIAIKYGYQSPTAFNRAFRSVHGIPPSAVWENKNFLTIYPRLRLKITLTGESEMQYRIEHKPEITIVGVKTKLTSNLEDNFELVPQFWKETMRTDIFQKLLGQTENQNENMIGVSVYHDEENFDYYIGVNSEKETDSEMETVQIPAGTWIVLKCQGKAHDAFKRIFERFFTEWLPVSEYKYVGNTDIEVYPVGDTTSTEYQFELWLRIEKKG